MDDAATVCGPERVGDIRAQRQRVADRHRALLQDGRQRRSLDVLHDDAGAAVLSLGCFVDTADERMIERGRGSGFAQQGVSRVGAGQFAGAQKLDGDVAIERLDRARGRPLPGHRGQAVGRSGSGRSRGVQRRQA